MKNFLAHIRATLTRKKGWWEQTFLFWRVLAGLRFSEEMIDLINYKTQNKIKYSTMKTFLRRHLLQLSKIFYSLAVKNGERKNYRLEKFFYYPSAFFLELKDLV